MLMDLDELVIDRRRRLKSDGVATVAVIGADKLDTVRQITGHYGRMHGAFGDMQLICYHAFDDAPGAPLGPIWHECR